MDTYFPNQHEYMKYLISFQSARIKYIFKITKNISQIEQEIISILLSYFI